MLAILIAQQQDLAGSVWQVTAFNTGHQAVTGVLEGSTPTAIFSPEGSVTGSGGGNSFSGTFTDSDGRITIGPLARLCRPGGGDGAGDPAAGGNGIRCHVRHRG